MTNGFLAELDSDLTAIRAELSAGLGALESSIAGADDSAELSAASAKLRGIQGELARLHDKVTGAEGAPMTRNPAKGDAPRQDATGN
jgi:hypothetical protein